MEREEEVRDPGSFCRVVFSALIIIAMIEIEVGPDLNGSGRSVVCAGPVVSVLDFSKRTSFGDSAHGADEDERSCECFGRQRLGIQKTLQVLQISPLGLPFTDDDVARGGHQGELKDWVRHSRIEACEILFSEICDVTNVFTVILCVHEATD